MLERKNRLDLRLPLQAGGVGYVCMWHDKDPNAATVLQESTYELGKCKLKLRDATVEQTQPATRGRRGQWARGHQAKRDPLES